MSAGLLRRAAALMRERAQDATPSPWTPWGDRSAPYNGPLDPPPPDYWRISQPDELAHIDTETEADAEHVASWHPDVALAVANWLDGEATLIDYAGDPGAASPAALAVARAYLGEEMS